MSKVGAVLEVLDDLYFLILQMEVRNLLQILRLLRFDFLALFWAQYHVQTNRLAI